MPVSFDIPVVFTVLRIFNIGGIIVFYLFSKLNLIVKRS